MLLIIESTTIDQLLKERERYCGVCQQPATKIKYYEIKRQGHWPGVHLCKNHTTDDWIKKEQDWEERNRQWLEAQNKKG